MPYVLKAPSSPSFVLKGMKGFQFEPLLNQELDVYILDVETGHDTFVISKRLYRTYFVLEGSGYFTISHQKYDVEPGILIEVPPNVEYSYSGKMRMVLISNPRWYEGNEEVRGKNPDVLKGPSVKSLFSKLGF